MVAVIYNLHHMISSRLLNVEFDTRCLPTAATDREGLG